MPWVRSSNHSVSKVTDEGSVYNWGIRNFLFTTTSIMGLVYTLLPVQWMLEDLSMEDWLGYEAGILLYG